MTNLIKPEILSVSIIEKSSFLKIQAVDLRFSNGELRTYERLKPSNRAAVMVLPIEGEDLLMVREYAVGTDRYELGFVKGSMELSEDPEQSANRELMEEIGFGAKQWTYLRNVSSNPTIMNNKMHIFIAQDLYPCQLQGDEPEPLQIVRFPLANINTLLSDPDFSEARNLTAVYALRDYLNNKDNK